MHRDRTKTDLAFHKTNICALESADSISSCFLQSPIFKAGPWNVSKAVASLHSPPRLQALRRRPSRALRPPSSQAQWHRVSLECFLPLPPAALLSLASGKGRQCNPPPLRPQTCFTEVAEGESSSWSNEARRTRTRSGREGTRRGTERSPRRRLGRTNLKVGRGEPARVGCFACHRQPGTRAEVPVEDAGALRRSPFPPAKTLTS